MGRSAFRLLSIHVHKIRCSITIVRLRRRSSGLVVVILIMLIHAFVSNISMQNTKNVEI